MLLDSNIIIYAAQAEHPQIRDFISEHDIAVSALSYVEVLGYHQLTEESRLYFEEFFRIVEALDIRPLTNAGVALAAIIPLAIHARYLGLPVAFIVSIPAAIVAVIAKVALFPARIANVPEATRRVFLVIASFFFFLFFFPA